MRSLIVAILLVSPAASAADRPRSGLLLGTDALRAFWIYPTETGFAMLELPSLVVPRPHGFWRLDRRHLVWRGAGRVEGGREWTIGEESWNFTPISRNSFWTVPEGARAVAALDSIELCEERWNEIRFLGPRLISFERKFSTECGLHPDGGSELRTLALDQWWSDERLAVGGALGDAGARAYRDGLEAGTASYREQWKDEDCGDPITDERNWTIERGAGRWVARGWAETHRLCGFGFEFDVAAALPDSLVGPDRLARPWSVIQGLVPGAIDAMSSPRGDLLVVMSADSLRVFTLGRGGEAPVQAARFPLRAPGRASGRPPERAVLIQWALGRYVEDWTRTLSRLEGR
jgi:hypothetical protein